MKNISLKMFFSVLVQISAQESRRKKKEYMDALERKVEILTSENNEYKSKIDILEDNNTSLLSQLQKLQAMVARSNSVARSNANLSVRMEFRNPKFTDRNWPACTDSNIYSWSRQLEPINQCKQEFQSCNWISIGWSPPLVALVWPILFDDAGNELSKW